MILRNSSDPDIPPPLGDVQRGGGEGDVGGGPGRGPSGGALLLLGHPTDRTGEGQGVAPYSYSFWDIPQIGQVNGDAHG